MMRNTYRLSTYDPNDDDDGFGWNCRYRGMTIWQLRSAIREMRKRGYDDDASILVENELNVIVKR